MVAIVVAYAANRAIGRDGGMPWHLPGDLRHFRELTTGGTVVMGRRTFESLPDAFRPLPERRNLVLSSDPDYDAPGGEVMTSLDAALAAAGEDCFVIGGGATYAEALPRADVVHATEIAESVEGDVFFPELAESEWRCAESGAPRTENGHTYVFRRYERRA